MCENICRSEKKYALGPAPYFPPPVVNAYPCQAIEVDTPIYEPLVKPVIKNIVHETTINVPKIEYRENVVEVPKVEYRPYPVVKDVETPIYQDVYKYKDVVVPQKQYRIKQIYKEVVVPEIEYVDKYVNKKYKRFKYVPKEVQIPFRPKKEIYEEVPVPRYIPQHLESVIQPDNITGQPLYSSQPMPMPMPMSTPMYANPEMTPINILSPAKSINHPTPNKCCLSSFFSPKKNNYIIDNQMEPVHYLDAESQIYTGQPHMGLYAPSPNSHGVIGYSYPFVVEEEKDKNFCKCLIETTSNVLAASGVALILAGKLTYDGINYLVSKSKQNKLKNKSSTNATDTNFEDSVNDTQQTESVNETSRTGRSYSYENMNQTLDEAI